eukprot:TRINITY_DN103570_c0_g1_i1.p1 TRINITY_DN103570_c0_g1~~TRINITY_DN103570_c0_g1_i1.p1  ORF type:complete len:188 (+),score=49.37 TRINITY_DN103570_c0_g1_i1:113-676(+)
MSDDEGPRGKGKGKGKGSKGGGGGKSKKDGAGSGGGGGMNVSRLKTMPKFLQDMTAKFKPTEEKKGLKHAELRDKMNPLGRNDDDEYDLEGAQIVGSDLTAEEVKMFQKRKQKAHEINKALEGDEDAEDGNTGIKFKRKSERTGQSAVKKSLKRGLDSSNKDGPQAEKASTSTKNRQRLSFEEDEDS